MPKVIRVGLDLSQGHCFSPSPCLTGSTSVLVNGVPVVRQFDPYLSVHSCGQSSHNMGVALEGSTTVFVEGFGVHRDADKISCGDVADNGSPDVIADEGGNSNSVGTVNTVGYTVGSPVIIYPGIKFALFRLLTGSLCPNFYWGGVGVSFPPLPALIPEWYTEIIEEDTGKVIKDKTIPVTISISPSLPSPLNFDEATGIISITNFSGISPLTTYTVTISNYVNTTEFNMQISITQAGILFTCP